MSEALLSRFDVVFLMRDEKSAVEDAELSRHIVRRRLFGGKEADVATPERGRVLDWAQSTNSEIGSLADRCSAQASSSNALPQELLTTYIRYARRYALPSLSKGAREAIKLFYIKRRRGDHVASGDLPVTPRQLEALIRLSEARARAELRRVVLRCDVEDVIELVTQGLNPGLLADLPEMPQRKGKSKLSSVVERIRTCVERRVRSGAQRSFREQELRGFAGDGVPDQLFDKALHKLNAEENVLLCQGGAYAYNGR